MPLLWLYPILQSIFTCNQLQTNILNYGKTKITKCHCCYHFRNLINDYLLLLWHSEFYFRRNCIYLANKDTKEYNENPELYSNFNNIRTGKILCIIGIVLGFIYLALVALCISYFGWEAMQNPELMEEKMRELMGR